MIISGRTQLVLRSAWAWLSGAAAIPPPNVPGETIELTLHVTPSISKTLYTTAGRSLLLHTTQERAVTLEI